MKKIAIVGVAPSTFNQAPFWDDSWQIYGIAYHAHKMSRCDLAFEIHHQSVMPEGYFTEEYINRCQEMRHLCLSDMAEILGGEPFPTDAAVDLMGRWYLQGTASYMMAHAIMQEPDEIGIWGIDLVDDQEYPLQRPCLESWIGFAMGRGIKVTIPDQSALMSVPWRYGIDGATRFSSWASKRNAIQRYLSHRINGLKSVRPFSPFADYVLGISDQQHNGNVTKMDIKSLCDGAQILAYDDALNVVNCIERGLDIDAALDAVPNSSDQQT